MATKKLPKKVIREVSQYINILKEDKLSIDEIYVFGSFAKGKQRRGSDIDVCVVSPKFRNFFKSNQYLWGKLPEDPYLLIEPVGFTPQDFEVVSSPLVYEIKKHGIKVEV